MPTCCFFDSDHLTGKSLADNSAIVLDGAPPQPISVSLATGTSDATTYGLGDIIQLDVTFDKSVTVDGGSPPVLVLDCTRARDAVYGSGDGTTTLTFEYKVCLFWQSCSNNATQTYCHRLLVPGVRVSAATAKSTRIILCLLVRHKSRQLVLTVCATSGHLNPAVCKGVTVVQVLLLILSITDCHGDKTVRFGRLRSLITPMGALCAGRAVA